MGGSSQEQNKHVYTLQIAHAQPDKGQDGVHLRFWRNLLLGLLVLVNMLP